MVTQILRVTEGHALAWSLWPGLALAGALVQAYLSPSQAPGMQGAMRSTFLPLEEIPERGKEVCGGVSPRFLSLSVCPGLTQRAQPCERKAGVY